MVHNSDNEYSEKDKLLDKRISGIVYNIFRHFGLLSYSQPSLIILADCSCDSALYMINSASCNRSNGYRLSTTSQILTCIQLKTTLF